MFPGTNYVDTTSDQSIAGEKVFTGELVYTGTVDEDTDVATKEYVDDAVVGASILGTNNAWTGNNTYNVNLPTSSLTPTTSTQLTTKAYVDSTSGPSILPLNNAWTGNNTYNTNLPTSTLTPGSSTQLTTKAYVDATVAAILGLANTWTNTNSFGATVNITAGGLNVTGGTVLSNGTTMNNGATVNNGAFTVNNVINANRSITLSQSGSSGANVNPYLSGGLMLGSYVPTATFNSNVGGTGGASTSSYAVSTISTPANSGSRTIRIFIPIWLALSLQSGGAIGYTASVSVPSFTYSIQRNGSGTFASGTATMITNGGTLTSVFGTLNAGAVYNAWMYLVMVSFVPTGTSSGATPDSYVLSLAATTVNVTGSPTTYGVTYNYNYPGGWLETLIPNGTITITSTAMQGFTQPSLVDMGNTISTACDFAVKDLTITGFIKGTPLPVFDSGFFLAALNTSYGFTYSLGTAFSFTTPFSHIEILFCTAQVPVAGTDTLIPLSNGFHYNGATTEGVQVEYGPTSTLITLKTGVTALYRTQAGTAVTSGSLRVRCFA